MEVYNPRKARGRRERNYQRQRDEKRRAKQARLAAMMRERSPQCPPSCRRKFGWPDRATAERVLDSMRRYRNERRLPPMNPEPHPYQCNKCGLWYLGRDRKMT